MKKIKQILAFKGKWYEVFILFFILFFSFTVGVFYLFPLLLGAKYEDGFKLAAFISGVFLGSFGGLFMVVTYNAVKRADRLNPIISDYYKRIETGFDCDELSKLRDDIVAFMNKEKFREVYLAHLLLVLDEKINTIKHFTSNNAGK